MLVDLTFLRCGMIAVALGILGILAPEASLAADPQTARDIYLKALAVMSDQKQPPYVTYRQESGGEGLRNVLAAQGYGQLRLTPGKSSDAWTVSHRTHDYITAIVDSENAGRFVSDHAVFDPT